MPSSGRSRQLAAVFVVAALAAMLDTGATACAGQRAIDALLFRIFLRDGSTLVSYGDFARVADRVVLSIPLGGLEGPAPPLHLVSIAEAAVDWERTDRYAEAMRARHYAATQGEVDFEALSADVARALNDVAIDQAPGEAAGGRDRTRAGGWRTGRRRTTAIVPPTSRSWRRCSTMRSPSCGRRRACRASICRSWPPPTRAAARRARAAGAVGARVARSGVCRGRRGHGDPSRTRLAARGDRVQPRRRRGQRQRTERHRAPVGRRRCTPGRGTALAPEVQIDQRLSHARRAHGRARPTNARSAPMSPVSRRCCTRCSRPTIKLGRKRPANDGGAARDARRPARRGAAASAGARRLGRAPRRARPLPARRSRARSMRFRRSVTGLRADPPVVGAVAIGAAAARDPLDRCAARLNKRVSPPAEAEAVHTMLANAVQTGDSRRGARGGWRSRPAT